MDLLIEFWIIRKPVRSDSIFFSVCSEYETCELHDSFRLICPEFKRTLISQVRFLPHELVQSNFLHLCLYWFELCLIFFIIFEVPMPSMQSLQRHLMASLGNQSGKDDLRELLTNVHWFTRIVHRSSISCIDLSILERYYLLHTFLRHFNELFLETLLVIIYVILV